MAVSSAAETDGVAGMAGGGQAHRAVATSKAPIQNHGEDVAPTYTVKRLIAGKPGT